MCRQPGISVAAVAQAHGVNSNLLRRWMKQYPVAANITIASAIAKLVPVQIETPHTSPTDRESTSIFSAVQPASTSAGP